MTEPEVWPSSNCPVPQIGVLNTSALASPGSFLENADYGAHPRPTEWESRPLDDSNVH